MLYIAHGFIIYCMFHFHSHFNNMITTMISTTTSTQGGMYDYGASLSGLWLLWNKLNPFSETVRVPSMGEISNTLMW
jgi:hypothetical protein